MDKKNQHYVWQKYLQAWTDGKILFCLRAGEINPRTTKNVAVEKYFYRAEELTEEEINFIERFAISISPPELKDMHRHWLSVHNRPFKFLGGIRGKFKGEEEFQLAKKQLENNMYEEVHSKIEEEGWPYLDSLMKKELSFFSKQDERINFLCFLTSQYLRTEKIRAAVFKPVAKAAESIKQHFNLDLERLRNPLIRIFSDNIAFNMEKDDLKLILFENRSEVSFVTGDQPVVNTCSINVPAGEQVKSVELYFPLTPELAVLVTDNEMYKLSAVIPINQEVAEYYNGYIFANSNSEIYGFDKEVLEKIKESNSNRTQAMN